MRTTPLPIPAPLLELHVDQADWDAQDGVSLRWLLAQMLVIRRFEEELLRLKGLGCIHGPVHTSIGQEGVAAGIGAALKASDLVAGTHRAHHLYLAKVLSACRPAADWDPVREDPTAQMAEEVRVLLAEIMGLADGCCRGRGGSMHLFHAGAGVAGTNAIVAGGVPHATGAAWAERQLGRDAMTVCCFGDGAMYQGVLDESANLAKLWQAPVVYLIENNQYSVGTTLDQSCSAAQLCHKAAAYGMPGLRVDGMDPLAVQLALAEVRRQGWLPCWIDVQTYRYLHHAGDLAGSSFGYRRKEEEATWRARDPITRCQAQLQRRGLIDDAGLRRLAGQADALVSAAVAACTETAGDGRLRVKPALWPVTADLAIGLRDESVLRLADPEPAAAVSVPATAVRQVRYVDTIAEVTGRWLERDPRVVVFGEEIANLGGGAYGATKGLAARFPGRVRNTPISEAGFCGLAAGAAMRGMHPVVEIMFSSFVLVAADQLLNQIGQLSHIYGGHVDMPLVLRTRIAAGVGYGAQHSLDPIAIFHHFPGWRIVAPSDAADYAGLFNAAMRARSPTLIVEHHTLYPRTGPLAAEAIDRVLPFGRARVLRSGADATALTYGGMVPHVLAAADQLAAEGVQIEVIDLRSLDAAGIDWDTIGASLRRTGILATVEEAPHANAIGGLLAAGAMERFFNAFDGPPLAITGRDFPLPVSQRAEADCLPNPGQIVDGLRRAALRRC